MRKIFIGTIAIMFSLAIYLVILLPNKDAEAGLVVNKSTSNSSLSSGLVGWWTFDGKDSTATTINDKSGNGRTGTRTGTTTLAVGKLGQAIKFDGSGGYVRVGTSAVVGPSSTFAISAWVKQTRRSGTQAILTQSYGAYPLWYFDIGSDGKMRLITRDNNAAGEINSLANTAIPLNTWTHVTVVYDQTNSTTAFYINGLLDRRISNTLITGPFTITKVDIGQLNRTTPDEIFNGSIDDVRAYNRVLTPTEILQLYAMGGGKVNKTDLIRAQLRNGLVALWTFDGKDVTATKVLDKSGNANDATITGMRKAKGKIGQSGSFDGVDDKLSTPADVSGNQTYAAWIYLRALPAVRDTIMVGDGEYQFLVDNTGKLTHYNGAWKPSTSALAVNRWYHVAETIDNDGNIRYYINGVLDASTNTGADTTTVNINIGTVSISYYHNGLMDDARVYNRILSQNEILQLYAMGGGKVNKTDLIRAQLRNGLQGHWTFDGKDTTASVAYDKSGNGRNGSRGNTTALKSGKIGQSMYFSGASGGIVSGVGGITTTLGISYSVWFNTPAWQSLNTLMHTGSQSASAGFHWAYINSAGNTLTWQYSTGTAYSAPGAVYTFSTNRWYHVVITHDYVAKEIKYYVNGSLVETDTHTNEVLSISNKTTDLGAYASGSSAMKGRLDDARVYNRVLSAEEIKQLYYMGK